MQLTLKQELGLKIARERYLTGEAHVVISGYAGSGKSTLIRFLIEELMYVDPDLTEDDIVYTAFTGKACTVMQQKGNQNVLTLHKLLYKNYLMPNGKYRHVPKTPYDIEYKVIVCDECSMVPSDLVALLLCSECFVIFCGDPGLLPPVQSEEDKGLNGYKLLQSPHVFLDEIMRQALDSDIIKLSMLVREGESIDGFKGKDAMVLPYKELNEGMLDWADIVLCGTNETRIEYNAKIRTLKGMTGEFCNGEKIICVQNEWEKIAPSGNALVNGTIGYLTKVFPQTWHYQYSIRVPHNKIDIITGHFASEIGDDFGEVNLDRKRLSTDVSSLPGHSYYRLIKNKQSDLIPNQFTYGYAVTTHKSQGSQWDKVLVLEERFPFSKEDHKKWLYTGLTRAAKKVVLVR